MTTAFAFSTLHGLGCLVYGGSLWVFSLVFLARMAGQGPALPRTMRAFMAWGPGLGLSMGALILGGLARMYQLDGGFSWSTETPEASITLVKHLLFLALWLSSFHLEIWTLEPLRKLAHETDSDQWQRSARRVVAQVLLNAFLFTSVGLAALMAGSR